MSIEILQQFETVSLREIDAVKLMNRVDTKFVFHISCYDEIVKKMLHDYKVLNIEGITNCRYENLYYDTKDFTFYFKHHNGKLNRYKIRYRNYKESNLNFFEIKFKSNKSRTIKKRIKTDSIEYSFSRKAEMFLKEFTSFLPEELHPILKIFYTRTTFVGKYSKERVTIDTQLEFSDGNKCCSLDYLVIAEVKQDISARSPFKTIMKEKHIREGSISKYCLGIIEMYPGLKSNLFKSKIRQVKKICNETN